MERCRGFLGYSTFMPRQMVVKTLKYFLVAGGQLLPFPQISWTSHHNLTTTKLMFA